MLLTSTYCADSVLQGLSQQAEATGVRFCNHHPWLRRGSTTRLGCIDGFQALGRHHELVILMLHSIPTLPPKTMLGYGTCRCSFSTRKELDWAVPQETFYYVDCFLMRCSTKCVVCISIGLSRSI